MLVRPGRRVFVGLEVDVDDGVAFAEETTLEDSAEEAGGSGDEQVGHYSFYGIDT